MNKKVLVTIAILAGLFIAVMVIKSHLLSDKPSGSGQATASSGGPTVVSVTKDADTRNIPVKGMVTLLDLGSDSCVPCKMMVPIIEKLKKKYEGKAAVVVIDVWKDTETGKKYGVRAIPTQIFFDKGGREIYRHVGFLDEDAIVRQLHKMGVS